MSENTEDTSKKMVFEHFSSIPEMFLNTVKTKPQNIALEFFRKGKIMKYTFEDYRDRVFWLAAGLITLDLKPKEHISILAHTSHRWCISDMSILCTGASSVTIFRTLDYEQVKFEIADSDSVGIFVCSKDNLKKVLKVWEKLPKLQWIVVIDRFDPDTGEDLRDPSAFEDIVEYQNCKKKDQIYHFDELVDIGKDQFLKSEEEIGQKIIEKINAIEEDDLATIIYTSGTTGIPKGVMLSHKNFISDAMMGFIAVGIRENERSTTYLPLAHSFAHTVEYIGAICKGNTLCFAENYDSLVANLHDFEPTAMIGVPYVFEQIHKRVWETVEELSPIKKMLFRNGISFGKKICDIVQSGKKPGFFKQKVHDLYVKVVFASLREKLGGKLRIFVSGGAALSPEIARFFWAAGVTVLEGYGLSESAPITHVNRPPDTTDVYPSNKIGTIGPTIGWDKWGSEIPYEAVDARIDDNGELLIKGPNVMLGYYKRPKETEETLIDIDGETWLRTGDLAAIDEDGYAKIIGRAKHILVLRTGKKVAPNHVEPIYKQHKDVEQIMLLGEGEKFIAALIVPNFENKERILDDLGLKNISNSEFTKNDKVHNYYKELLKEAEDGKLSHFEKLKEFRLVSEPWTEENDLLTPSLKLKRSVITEHCKGLIDEIFQRKG